MNRALVTLDASVAVLCALEERECVITHWARSHLATQCAQCASPTTTTTQLLLLLLLLLLLVYHICLKNQPPRAPLSHHLLIVSYDEWRALAVSSE